MSGTHRSAARAASSSPEGSARRGRALMAAGVLLGTLMLATAGALMGDAFNSPGLDPVHWPHDAGRTSGKPGPVAADSSGPAAVRSERAAVASGPVATRPAKTATGPTVAGAAPTAGRSGATGSTPAAVHPEGGRGTRRPHSATPRPDATPTPAPSHGSRPGPEPTPSRSTDPAASTPPSHPHGTPPGHQPSRTHGPRR
ncbi:MULTISPECIES: hypothetical protein [unclassified Nonomuraea]|uniref:hypothetical protein n=1 Tax=unclassified Nonomuraea TaxID=2593643 RepID=UPI0033E8C32B